MKREGILVSKAYVGKIGNNRKSREVEEVLNFSDYVFEIDGKDIKDAKITYYYDSIENVEFIDGKTFNFFRNIRC